MLGVIFPIAFTFCYFLLFDFLLIDFCLLFSFSCFSDSSLSSQESILTCLLFFWLILKLHHFRHGSITSYYSIYIILLNCIVVDYFILFCRDYYLVLFLLFFFYFHFIFLLVLLSPFKFYLILCCICCFMYLVFVLLYLLSFYIIMCPM